MLDVFLRSRASSAPVWLYAITWGPTPSHRLRLTSGETPVWHEGDEYQPAQVRHGRITASGTLDQSEVELRTPRTNPLFDVFRVYPPERPVRLVIFRGERDDPDGDFRAVWRGRILNFGVSGLEATYTCEPGITSIRRPGLRRTYQYGCPHVLYGPHCRADKAAASTPATVAALEGSVVTLESGWAAADPVKYLKGLLEWDNEGDTLSRTILQVLDADRLLLAGTLPGLSVGDSVTAALGCNRRVDDCRELHDNILNYGGQPWISKIDPLGPRNIFY